MTTTKAPSPAKIARKPKAMTPLVVRCPSALLRSLKRAATAEGKDLSTYVRDVLASYGVPAK